jgi:mono/diheme cytochrome c family protein/uncharacterized membrane protein
VETFGRLHVAVVHFPIALLGVAGLLEAWRVVRGKREVSSSARLCLVLGAAAAVAAAASGWVHRSGGFEGRLLQQHQWWGIATAIVAVLLVAFSWVKGAASRVVAGGAVACAFMVGMTGHFGGEVTHGEGYLTELVWNRPTPASTPGKAPVLEAAATSTPMSAAGRGGVDFDRDVHPILAANCYECHSSAKRRGGLSLDAKSAAFKGGNSGALVVAGKPDESLLMTRVTGGGGKKLMPPPGKKPLGEAQLKVLREWVAQGAKWPEAKDGVEVPERPHWAFVRPVRPNLPVVKNTYWPRNGIDHFVLARLEKEGLKPSAEADKVTLCRRVYLDLIGLPPKPEEVDAFVADTRADAYERLVDKLLDSAHYGERWGRHWLDLARYADTNGYEKDAPRSIWAYRDWVINAYNRDLPFNEFVIDQLAGDMLPNATPEQTVATGFNRNTMTNEEGGIDVEEFRYKAIVDRVQTTSTAFLGLTLHCAQCHDHKYDPFTHKEYFQFFGLLNNADEPTYDVKSIEVAAKREEVLRRADAIEAGYAAAFPAFEPKMAWQVTKATTRPTKSGATLAASEDGTVSVSGPVPATDEYTVELSPITQDVTHVRLEVLTDPSLPKKGPGREGGAGKNGNFVLSEIEVLAQAAGEPAPKAVKIAAAEADFSQAGFEVAKAIDGKVGNKEGWAISDPAGHTNSNRTATFSLAQPIPAGTGKVVVKLKQGYANHTLGNFRLALGKMTQPAGEVTAEMRERFLQEKQADWESRVVAKASHWTVARPVKYARANEGTIRKLDDDSLLFTGDNYYREEYDVEYETDAKAITGLRLEVLPHAELQKGGPGRNPNGGFLLSELGVSLPPTGPATTGPATSPASAAAAAAATQPTTVALINASANFANDTVARAIDGKRDTHWTNPIGGDGQPRIAVVQFKDKVGDGGTTRLAVSMVQNYHQQENMGRVRLSVTTDANPRACGVPADVEEAILVPAAKRSTDQAKRVREQFLRVTPLLAEQRMKVAELRKGAPAFPTTLVLRERETSRNTRVHHRGEYLQPTNLVVEPGVPVVLPPLPKGQKPDRLTLARWIVAPENPLTGRVVMNRTWAQYFGRGIVTTVDDFGTMGQLPTHPELLDWLATEFIRQGWSLKQMHRLIVNSATYRQASTVTEELRQKDPVNALYARGPRVRVEGEIVRDVALAAAGLLSEKVGGPSVFPPQPAGVSELSWGPLAWTTSPGEDRYRRGLYTFLKRTSPYPGLTTFDAPTSEVTCPIRTRSNTPLQALTTLNDEVYVEAARAMAGRVIARGGDAAAKAQYAFRLCVAREPQKDELDKIIAFYGQQLERLKGQPDVAAKVALQDPNAKPPENVADLAAWTLVSRAVLNLDETITKE